MKFIPISYCTHGRDGYGSHGSDWSYGCNRAHRSDRPHGSDGCDGYGSHGSNRSYGCNGSDWPDGRDGYGSHRSDRSHGCNRPDRPHGPDGRYGPDGCGGYSGFECILHACGGCGKRRCA